MTFPENGTGQPTLYVVKQVIVVRIVPHYNDTVFTSAVQQDISNLAPCLTSTADC